MCGIIGYAGSGKAVPVLMQGLSKLEYRGYDSAGICVITDSGFCVEKAKGRLQALQDRIKNSPVNSGSVGIGHTRWATHGAPSDINSHPHLSNSGKIAVVHNGIIDNESALRRWLENHGVSFRSETDTEVIANLVGFYYDQSGDFIQAVRTATARLLGSFALGILCEDQAGTIMAVKKESPLIVGFGRGENFIASDVPAILKHTDTVVYLDDDEMALIDEKSVRFLDMQGEEIQRSPQKITWEISSAERGGYDHFMMKEIMEQPKAVRDTICPRIQKDKVTLEDIEFSSAFLSGLRKIYIVACGSAYYAALLAKYTLEWACRIPTEAMIASEFRYCDPVVDDKNLVIVISQSGETADTLAALKEAKRRGATTLAVVNVVGSAIAKTADKVLYTWAGPEISVATTKAFSTQLAAVYLLTLYMADVLGTVRGQEYSELVHALSDLPRVMEQILNSGNMEKAQYLANLYQGRHNAFYIGRNTDSPICLEGSLKLKEIAYIHSEAYPAGELKHGPISLIEQGTLVIALATVDSLFPKTLANIKEVKARGAEVLCVCCENRKADSERIADHVFAVPDFHPAFLPSLSVLPLQLFAYYMAVYRGNDVDKPRNLAKSVTVE